jgi:DNA gyrase/topoisomerase IV subunit A
MNCRAAETIERLRAILASERLLMQIIVDELKEVARSTATIGGPRSSTSPAS